MNKKSIADRANILRCLVEGLSIRATARITGASKNTIARLLAEVGESCEIYQHFKLVNLNCETVQVDEIWSFVYAKQKRVPNLKVKKAPGEAGDIWTWTAICADSKLILSYHIGGRSAKDGDTFIRDLCRRLAHRIQLTSDGHKAYLKPIGKHFGNQIDYAMLVKLYGRDPGDVDESERRYSPPICTGTVLHVIAGNPDLEKVSTSYAERQNLTMRMHMRRFTRLTNGFSKKVEAHANMLALYFMHYNFCRKHETLKTTPAVAAKVTDKIWTLEDVIRMNDEYWTYREQLAV